MTSGAGPSFGPDWSAAWRRGSDAELRGWLDVAMEACDEADVIALTHFRRDLRIETKPDRTYVTQADTAIEQMIRGRLGDAFPDHGIIGEEFGVESGDAAIRWYIDPIDATNNFIRGVPVFATLLAVERDGELQAAVLSAPALRERWWAWRAGGAWVRNADAQPRRIHVSAVTALADAQIFHNGHDLSASGLAPGFEGILDDAWRERGFGDFWGYTLLAEGSGEAMIEAGLKPWDAAAPMLLVEEAGGLATDFEGSRSVGSGTFIASNGHLHDLLRQRLDHA